MSVPNFIKIGWKQKIVYFGSFHTVKGGAESPHLIFSSFFFIDEFLQLTSMYEPNLVDLSQKKLANFLWVSINFEGGLEFFGINKTEKSQQILLTKSTSANVSKMQKVLTELWLRTMSRKGKNMIHSAMRVYKNWGRYRKTTRSKCCLIFQICSENIKKKILAGQYFFENFL